MGFTPTAIERTKFDALPVRSDDRPEADGAASATDPASTPDRVPPTLLSATPGVAEADQQALQRGGPPMTKAERNMQQLMGKVAGPLRTYIKEGPLSDDEKKALVEALTQFDADVGQLSETVDVEQLNKEMRAAFERFYDSLIRIFGPRNAPDAEVTARTATEATRPEDNPGAPSVQGTASGEDEPRLSPTDFSFSGTEQSAEGAERPLTEPLSQGEQKGGVVDEAYQRIASMYTALYGLSDDQSSSFLNEQG